jgi:hypothetical protein
LLSFDDLKDEAVRYISENESRNINSFNSVDGLFYFHDRNNQLKLIFIEFKTFSDTENNNFSLNQECSNNEHCCYVDIIEKLEEEKSKNNNMVKNEIKKNLRLKAFESLYSVFPYLIDKFSHIGNLSERDKMGLKYFLYNAPKAFYVVFNDFTENNEFSRRIYNNEDYFNITKMSKYPYDIVKTLNDRQFMSFIEEKI